MSDNKTIFGLILILIGSAFLLERIFPWLTFDYIWPLILIAIGFYLIQRKK